MDKIIAAVNAQIAAAEEAAIKRDLNKAVAALIEAVRALGEGSKLLATTAPEPAKKVVAKKAVAKTVKPAKPKAPKAETPKRTAPLIKPK